jgi:hypothetical protein
MILNINSIPNKFKCNKRLGKYLVYHNVSLLGIDEKYYYFARTDELKDALNNAPWYLKMFKN